MFKIWFDNSASRQGHNTIQIEREVVKIEVGFICRIFSVLHSIILNDLVLSSYLDLRETLKKLFGEVIFFPCNFSTHWIGFKTTNCKKSLKSGLTWLESAWLWSCLENNCDPSLTWSKVHDFQGLALESIVGLIVKNWFLKDYGQEGYDRCKTTQQNEGR